MGCDLICATHYLIPLLGILFPGIWENDIVCKMAPYLVSYLSKANLLAITPLTTSILLITGIPREGGG